MKFSDLQHLPYDEFSNAINIQAILEKMPTVPVEVVQQVFSEHGKNPEFVEFYQDLELDRIHWELRKVKGSEIISAKMNSNFERWFAGVGERVGDFKSKGWDCIDSRPEVQNHWAKYKTWVIPPVFIHGLLLGLDSVFQLVEGHTRVGLLNGLITHGIIDPDIEHAIWFGSAVGC